MTPDDSTLFLLACGHGLDWRHLHPEDRPAAARTHFGLPVDEATISARSLELICKAISGEGDK